MPVDSSIHCVAPYSATPVAFQFRRFVFPLSSFVPEFQLIRPLLRRSEMVVEGEILWVVMKSTWNVERRTIEKRLLGLF